MGNEEECKKAFQEQTEATKNSRHHVIPKSRTSRKRARNEENIVFVNQDLHEKFHALMMNRTPEECVEFLLDYFWQSDVSILIKVLKERGGYKMTGAKKYTFCPHCHDWGYNKIVGGSFRYLEMKCLKCHRIFVEA